MQAVVWHGIGDIRQEKVPEPKIRDDTDAIVRMTASAICGTDLHFVRGTMPGMKEGTILGHEAVGVVEETGKNVRNLEPGDRVVIPSTIACDACFQCRMGLYDQCDVANPNGPLYGSTFYGGTQTMGAIDGLQAEYARIPFANMGPVKLPEEVSDDQAIMCSDIFPTGYFGADLANIEPGNSVAVFGCGPVGLFCIVSAGLFDAGQIIAVDKVESRLAAARKLGAATINFEEEHPIEVIRELTRGYGVDRVIEAVGVDAVAPTIGPAAEDEESAARHREQVRMVAASDASEPGERWAPGDAPGQGIEWSVAAVRKSGTVSSIAVYPPTADLLPFGQAWNKNLSINLGNTHHRRYLPRLIGLTRAGAVDPASVLSQRLPFDDVMSAYESFNQREEGWVKVELALGNGSR